MYGRHVDIDYLLGGDLIEFDKHPSHIPRHPIAYANTGAGPDALNRAEIETSAGTICATPGQAGMLSRNTTERRSTSLQQIGGWESSEMVRRYEPLAPEHLAGALGNIVLIATKLAALEKLKGSAFTLTP
jgi:hypothetical protein